MTKHVIEQLERRCMLAVISNGLPVGDPAYLAVDVAAGGSFGTVAPGTPGGLTFGSYQNVMFDYDAFLDVGTGTTGGRVFQLSAYAATATVTAVNSATSSGSLIFTNGTTPARINFTVTDTLPLGGDRVNRTLQFSAAGYDMRNAKMFDYMDADIFNLADDVLVVRGDVPSNSLELSTVDGQSFTWLSQEDTRLNAGAQLTGFAADKYSDLLNAINAGGFNAAAAGTIDQVDLPPGNQPRIGFGYGPADVTQTLQYNFLVQDAATVTTTLQLRAALSEPAMEVYYFATNTLVPDGNLTRNQAMGTDFGTGVAPQTHWFEVRDFGTEDLVLTGVPLVDISGTNASSFRVIRQPLSYVGAGNSTYFSILYTPTQGGSQNADVTIYSNDSHTSPYTFRIFGGTGSGVPVDQFEDDGPKTIDTARDWNTQFQQVKLKAKVISTQGVGQLHTIHAATDVDWVKFYQTTNSPVVIETFAPSGDTRLYLFDSNGKRVAMDDNSGPGVSAKISLSSLPVGTYYVRADESGNNAVIPVYTLFVRSGTLAALTPIDGMPPVAGSPSVYVNSARKLWVWGTSQADVINVDLVGTSIRVNVNANTWYFPLSEVSSLEIRGECGSDSITVGAGMVPATVRGGQGDDTIVSSTGRDSVIYGDEGNDSIQAGNGNNKIYGGDGNDTITGGSGNDSIEGGAGDNLIHGGAGDDTINGCDGKDTIYGDAGNDVVSGFASDDSLFGGDGNDTIDAGDGSDYVQSDAGVDQVTTWQDGSVDTILSNTSQDLLYVDNDPNGILDIVINSPI